MSENKKIKVYLYSDIIVKRNWNEEERLDAINSHIGNHIDAGETLHDQWEIPLEHYVLKGREGYSEPNEHRMVRSRISFIWTKMI